MKHIIYLFAYLFISITINAQPGFLDKTFGEEGIVITVTNPGGINYSHCNSIALQKDGKIIAGGSGAINDSVGGFLLIRYREDGFLDSSFGIDGKVVTDIPGYYETINTVLILEDGKILAGGCANGLLNIAIVRYYPDGKIDSSFGTNGIVNTDIGLKFTISYRPLMALQPDGKIAMTGIYSRGYNDNDRGYIMRYLPDGQADESFGDKGLVITDFGNFVDINAITVQEDGKILIGAKYGGYGIIPSFLIARYLDNGELDKEFGSNGIAKESIPSWGAELYALTLQKDGKIVAGGVQGSADGPGFGLMRFEDNGKLDALFGEAGKTITLFDSFYSYINSIIIQDDGKIIGVGNLYLPSTDIYKFAIARYVAQGKIDEGFGINGKQITAVSEDVLNVCFASAIQADGKILAAGDLEMGADGVNLALVRYIGGDGILPVKYNYVQAIKQSNSIIISWQTTEENNNAYFLVEHAAAGNEYSEIAKVNSTGSGSNAAQYSYTDIHPANGKNLYRLKQVNKDGAYSYSKTISVNFLPAGMLQLYPNPAANTITIEGLYENENTKLILYDAYGKMIQQAVANSSVFTMQLQQMAAGSYYIKVISKKQNATLPFIKK